VDIALPFTRQDFIKICEKMNKKASTLQAIESMLQSRGKKLEESKKFSYEKFLHYLNKSLPLMPPFD